MAGAPTIVGWSSSTRSPASSTRKQDDRDVVAAARRVGLVDQLLRCEREVVGALMTAVIWLVGDHRGESVLQQEHVPGPDRVCPGVDLDRRLRTERTGDDRALRVLRRLLARELAPPRRELDERVVLCQALRRRS